jgi:hypothetical protein
MSANIRVISTKSHQVICHPAYPVRVWVSLEWRTQRQRDACGMTEHLKGFGRVYLYVSTHEAIFYGVAS